MCELHLTAGIMSHTALFKTLCVKGGTHPNIAAACRRLAAQPVQALALIGIEVEN
jgi:hypothetical protein